MSAPLPAPAPPCVAIEIGGTKLQIAVGTPAGEILDRRRFAVDPAGGAAGIRNQIIAALPGFVDQWRPAAVGVGYGGPVDRRTCRIVKSHHVSGWDEFPLGEWLADVASLPVAVDNDANVAALGEALHGAGRGCDPVFYVTVGSGVGGGLVCGGRIFHGSGMGEAEIGHLRLGPAGEITEDYCSGWSLDRRIRSAVAAAPASPLARLVQASPGQEARHLGPALAAGDPLAAEILDGAAEKLALALSHVGHLCHPEVIVLGGGVALLGEPLRQAVATHLGRFMMEALRSGPRVALAALREDAVPVGAIALAAHRFPTLFP
ncbi:MAG: ROK family protein [Planctomycetia bacterium]